MELMSIARSSIFGINKYGFSIRSISLISFIALYVLSAMVILSKKIIGHME